VCRAFTLGIAYTKLPIGAEVAESDVVVVKKATMEVRLSVNWRWIFVCGARGRGNATSIGFAIMMPSRGADVMLTSEMKGK
jgi:tRNA(Met) C34 N-acetyltransferase TmcA